ncbi:MAG: methyltransferase [Planctomycetaceae bacterium]|nr:methyltransferase [Planctomycetaceae bacterium]
MISPKLYKSSRFYDFFIKALGYESSIDRFLRSLTLECGDECRVLDAGCGTGLLGLHFLQRFPNSRLHATDLEPNFLQATLTNAESQGVDRERISVGVANISQPHITTCLEGNTTQLEEGSFDVICIGAVVGYADDIEVALQQLVRLLAPGGYLINIEMNESPSGQYVSRRFHYQNIKLHRMCEVLTEAGCQVEARRFKARHLPAKLTRTGIVARRTAAS